MGRDAGQSDEGEHQGGGKVVSPDEFLLQSMDKSADPLV
jgi:hypothetical protein